MVIQLLTKFKPHYALCLLWNFSFIFCSQDFFFLFFCSNSNIWPPLALALALALACNPPLADTPPTWDWDSPSRAEFRQRQLLDESSANKTMELTEIMVNNKFIKLFLEILGHWKFTLLISQYFNVYLHLLPHSTLNIWCERFLKQFHKIPITTDVPECILRANE